MFNFGLDLNAYCVDTHSDKVAAVDVFLCSNKGKSHYRSKQSFYREIGEMEDEGQKQQRHACLSYQMTCFES